jgi:hypothetical protein
MMRLFELPLHAVIDINGYAYRHLGGGVFADNGHGHAPHFIPASIPADEPAPPEPVQIDERANALDEAPRLLVLVATQVNPGGAS